MTGYVRAAGDAYDAYVGRLSRRVAEEFARRLEVPLPRAGGSPPW
ncbi:MAG TPA: hypothetical protein VF657_03000 [Actinoplanes sp.]